MTKSNLPVVEKHVDLRTKDIIWRTNAGGRSLDLLDKTDSEYWRDAVTREEFAAVLPYLTHWVNGGTWGDLPYEMAQEALRCLEKGSSVPDPNKMMMEALLYLAQSDNWVSVGDDYGDIYTSWVNRPNGPQFPGEYARSIVEKVKELQDKQS